MNILLPVYAIERRHCNGFDAVRLQAIRIDADAIRMRARHVERLDSAMAAEVMLRDPGVKSVCLDVVFPIEQTKVAPGNDQVKISCHTADAAIALIGPDSRGRLNFEPNSPTMATA